MTIIFQANVLSAYTFEVNTHLKDEIILFPEIIFLKLTFYESIHNITKVSTEELY